MENLSNKQKELLLLIPYIEKDLADGKFGDKDLMDLVTDLLCCGAGFDEGDVQSLEENGLINSDYYITTEGKQFIKGMGEKEIRTLLGNATWLDKVENFLDAHGDLVNTGASIASVILGIISAF